MKITPQLAHILVLGAMPKSKALNCYEYDSLYVFMVVPKNFNESKGTDGLLDCLVSVDKKTGKISDFKPFYISTEEYNRGKEIKKFR